MYPFGLHLLLPIASSEKETPRTVGSDLYYRYSHLKEAGMCYSTRLVNVPVCFCPYFLFCEHCKRVFRFSSALWISSPPCWIHMADLESLSSRTELCFLQQLLIIQNNWCFLSVCYMYSINHPILPHLICTPTVALRFSLQWPVFMCKYANTTMEQCCVKKAQSKMRHRPNFRK